MRRPEFGYDGELELKILVLAFFYSVVAVALGSVGYLTDDVAAYLNGAETITSGVPLYSLPHSAYPPVLYILIATVLWPLEILGFPVVFDPSSYLSIFVVKFVILIPFVATTIAAASHVSNRGVGWYSPS